MNHYRRRRQLIILAVYLGIAAGAAALVELIYLAARAAFG